MRARRTRQARTERISGPAARFANRSSSPGRLRGSSGYALESAAPGSDRSNIQARKEQLAGASIPLIADRLPAQIETDVGASADVHTALVGRELDVDLEEALHHFASLLVGGVERELPSALTAQRGAGQLVARGRNDARDHGMVDAFATLDQSHLDIAAAAAHEIDVLL